jgi:hypothetical protein
VGHRRQANSSEIGKVTLPSFGGLRIEAGRVKSGAEMEK